MTMHSTDTTMQQHAHHQSSEHGVFKALTDDEIRRVSGGMFGAIAGAVAGPVISSVTANPAWKTREVAGDLLGDMFG